MAPTRARPRPTSLRRTQSVGVSRLLRRRGLGEGGTSTAYEPPPFCKLVHEVADTLMSMNVHHLGQYCLQRGAASALGGELSYPLLLTKMGTLGFDTALIGVVEADFAAAFIVRHHGFSLGAGWERAAPTV